MQTRQLMCDKLSVKGRRFDMNTLFDIRNHKIDNQCMEHSVINLLPQDSQTTVDNIKLFKKFLVQIYNTITLLMDSLDKFYIAHDYSYFDPHVGESACQIRAYMFFLISKTDRMKEAKEKINSLNLKKTYLSNIIKNLEQIYCSEKTDTLSALVKKYDIDFTISQEECFIFKSYVLTSFKIKAVHGYEVSRPLLRKFLMASKWCARKTIQKYQLSLSRWSCAFIKSLVDKLGFESNEYKNILNSVKYDERERMIYPCFFSSKIIFLHMMKMKCPVLAIYEDENMSNRSFVLFSEGSNVGKLVGKIDDGINPTRCVVITFISRSAVTLSPAQFMAMFNRHGLYDIMLMNIAAHPQFSGKRLAPLGDTLIEDNDASLTLQEHLLDEEFKTYKEDSHIHKLDFSDQSNLAIRHIFFDTLENQLLNHVTVAAVSKLGETAKV